MGIMFTIVLLKLIHVQLIHTHTHTHNIQFSDSST